MGKIARVSCGQDFRVAQGDEESEVELLEFRISTKALRIEKVQHGSV